MRVLRIQKLVARFNFIVTTLSVLLCALSINDIDCQSYWFLLLLIQHSTLYTTDDDHSKCKLVRIVVAHLSFLISFVCLPISLLKKIVIWSPLIIYDICYYRFCNSKSKRFPSWFNEIILEEFYFFIIEVIFLSTFRIRKVTFLLVAGIGFIFLFLFSKQKIKLDQSLFDYHFLSLSLLVLVSGIGFCVCFYEITSNTPPLTSSIVSLLSGLSVLTTTFLFFVIQDAIKKYGSTALLPLILNNKIIVLCVLFPIAFCILLLFFYNPRFPVFIELVIVILSFVSVGALVAQYSKILTPEKMFSLIKNDKNLLCSSACSDMNNGKIDLLFQIVEIPLANRDIVATRKFAKLFASWLISSASCISRLFATFPRHQWDKLDEVKQALINCSDQVVQSQYIEAFCQVLLQQRNCQVSESLYFIYYHLFSLNRDLLENNYTTSAAKLLDNLFVLVCDVAFRFQIPNIESIQTEIPDFPEDKNRELVNDFIELYRTIEHMAEKRNNYKMLEYMRAMKWPYEFATQSLKSFDFCDDSGSTREQARRLYIFTVFFKNLKCTEEDRIKKLLSVNNIGGLIDNRIFGPIYKNEQDDKQMQIVKNHYYQHLYHFLYSIYNYAIQCEKATHFSDFFSFLDVFSSNYHKYSDKELKTFFSIYTYLIDQALSIEIKKTVPSKPNIWNYWISLSQAKGYLLKANRIVDYMNERYDYLLEQYKSIINAEDFEKGIKPSYIINTDYEKSCDILNRDKD